GGLRGKGQRVGLLAPAATFAAALSHFEMCPRHHLYRGPVQPLRASDAILAAASPYASKHSFACCPYRPGAARLAAWLRSTTCRRRGPLGARRSLCRRQVPSALAAHARSLPT